MMAHALMFGAQNAGNLVERVLLAPDAAASAVLGLGATAFGLLSAFATNTVGVCQLVARRRTGNGDVPGAGAVTQHALILAGGGGVFGLVLAIAAGSAAALVAGPARHASVYLAAQSLALGPQLCAAALTGYFIGTRRVRAGLLAAVSVLPIAVHIALAWILTGLLGWSLAGAAMARIGAAAAIVAGVLVMARTELRAILASAGRVDWALLWTLVCEGSTLGLQQVVAGLMVWLLYYRAAGGGDVPCAALTLTHSGVYPVLFAVAWGTSQAVGAAAALAVGRGNGKAFARVAWLGLGLAAAPAFALPWGAYALIGPATLGWLVEGSTTGTEVLTLSLLCMRTLAIFFVVDFAVNYLSTLLRAAREQAYLLKATAVVASGFGLANIVLPLPHDVAYLMGAFITAQAFWALLLLIRVIKRWPSGAGRDVPAYQTPSVQVHAHPVHAQVHVQSQPLNAACRPIVRSAKRRVLSGGRSG
jgi:Na+-driven multidrug efflux pump